MGRSRALGEAVHVDPVVDDDRVGGRPACRDQPGLERAPRRLADCGHGPAPSRPSARRPARPQPPHSTVLWTVRTTGTRRTGARPCRERPGELGDLGVEVNEVGADALDRLASRSAASIVATFALEADPPRTARTHRRRGSRACGARRPGRGLRRRGRARPRGRGRPGWSPGTPRPAPLRPSRAGSPPGGFARRPDRDVGAATSSHSRPSDGRATWRDVATRQRGRLE